MTRTIVGLLAALLLASCASKPAPEKRYDMRGEVMSLDATNQIATIKHEKIGDWMDPMTMEFPVKPKAEFDKLGKGDQITGVVVVQGVDYHLTSVTVVKKAGAAQ